MKCGSKVMHGQYITSRNRQFMDEEDTLLLVLGGGGDMKGETEIEMWK